MMRMTEKLNAWVLGVGARFSARESVQRIHNALALGLFICSLPPVSVKRNGLAERKKRPMAKAVLISVPLFPRAKARYYSVVLASTLALVSILISAASAQVTGQNKPTGEETVPTNSVTSRLVVETVTVKDKQGKPVPGLTTKDFTITEDGVLQKISFCEHQVLSDATTPLPPSKPGSEDIHIYNKLGRTAITAEAAGQVKYRDKRLIALYFDMTAMP